MLAIESESTLPRESAEQPSSAIAYTSVAVGTLISPAQVREERLPEVPLQNGAQKPLVTSGQEKCPRLCGLLSFFGPSLMSWFLL